MSYAGEEALQESIDDSAVRKRLAKALAKRHRSEARVEVEALVPVRELSSRQDGQLRKVARDFVLQLNQSQTPVFYAGSKFSRDPELPGLLEELSSVTGIPVAHAWSAKGLFDGRFKNSIGTYNGAITPWLGTRNYVEQKSDLVLRLGDAKVAIQSESGGATFFPTTMNATVERFVGERSFRHAQDLKRLLEHMIEEAKMADVQKSFERSDLMLPEIPDAEEMRDLLKNKKQVTRAEMVRLLDGISEFVKKGIQGWGKGKIRYEVAPSTFWFLAQRMLHPVDSDWRRADISSGVTRAASKAITAKDDEFWVSINGDGGFGAHGLEIVQEAAKVGTRMATIILDDNLYKLGTNAQMMSTDNQKQMTSLRKEGVDYATVARNLGAKAFTARNNEELYNALQEAQAYDGPTVIVVPVEQDEEKYWEIARFQKIVAGHIDRNVRRAVSFLYGLRRNLEKFYHPDLYDESWSPASPLHLPVGQTQIGDRGMVLRTTFRAGPDKQEKLTPSGEIQVSVTYRTHPHLGKASPTRDMVVTLKGNQGTAQSLHKRLLDHIQVASEQDRLGDATAIHEVLSGFRWVYPFQISDRHPTVASEFARLLSANGVNHVAFLTGDVLNPVRDAIDRTGAINMHLFSASEAAIGDWDPDTEPLKVKFATYNVGSWPALSRVPLTDAKPHVVVTAGPSLADDDFSRKLSGNYDDVPVAWHTPIDEDSTWADTDADLRFGMSQNYQILKVGKLPFRSWLLFIPLLIAHLPFMALRRAGIAEAKRPNWLVKFTAFALPTPSEQMRRALDIAKTENQHTLIKIPVDVSFWRTTSSDYGLPPAETDQQVFERIFGKFESEEEVKQPYAHLRSEARSTPSKFENTTLLGIARSAFSLIEQTPWYHNAAHINVEDLPMLQVISSKLQQIRQSLEGYRELGSLVVDQIKNEEKRKFVEAMLAHKSHPDDARGVANLAEVMRNLNKEQIIQPNRSEARSEGELKITINGDEFNVPSEIMEGQPSNYRQLFNAHLKEELAARGLKIQKGKVMIRRVEGSETVELPFSMTTSISQIDDRAEAGLSGFSPVQDGDEIIIRSEARARRNENYKKRKRQLRQEPAPQVPRRSFLFWTILAGSATLLIAIAAMFFSNQRDHRIARSVRTEESERQPYSGIPIPTEMRNLVFDHIVEAGVATDAPFEYAAATLQTMQPILRRPNPRFAGTNYGTEKNEEIYVRPRVDGIAYEEVRFHVVDVHAAILERKGRALVPPADSDLPKPLTKRYGTELTDATEAMDDILVWLMEEKLVDEEAFPQIERYRQALTNPVDDTDATTFLAKNIDSDGTPRVYINRNAFFHNLLSIQILKSPDLLKQNLAITLMREVGGFWILEKTRPTQRAKDLEADIVQKFNEERADPDGRIRIRWPSQELITFLKQDTEFIEYAAAMVIASEMSEVDWVRRTYQGFLDRDALDAQALVRAFEDEAKLGTDVLEGDSELLDKLLEPETTMDALEAELGASMSRVMNWFFNERRMSELGNDQAYFYYSLLQIIRGRLSETEAKKPYRQYSPGAYKNSAEDIRAEVEEALNFYLSFRSEARAEKKQAATRRDRKKRSSLVRVLKDVKPSPLTGMPDNRYELVVEEPEANVAAPKTVMASGSEVYDTGGGWGPHVDRFGNYNPDLPAFPEPKESTLKEPKNWGPEDHRSEARSSKRNKIPWRIVFRDAFDKKPPMQVDASMRLQFMASLLGLGFGFVLFLISIPTVLSLPENGLLKEVMIGAIVLSVGVLGFFLGHALQYYAYNAYLDPEDRLRPQFLLPDTREGILKWIGNIQAKLKAMDKIEDPADLTTHLQDQVVPAILVSLVEIPFSNQWERDALVQSLSQRVTGIQTDGQVTESYQDIRSHLESFLNELETSIQSVSAQSRSEARRTISAESSEELIATYRGKKAVWNAIVKLHAAHRVNNVVVIDGVQQSYDFAPGDIVIPGVANPLGFDGWEETPVDESQIHAQIEAAGIGNEEEIDLYIDTLDDSTRVATIIRKDPEKAKNAQRVVMPGRPAGIDVYERSSFHKPDKRKSRVLESKHIKQEGQLVALNIIERIVREQRANPGKNVTVHWSTGNTPWISYVTVGKIIASWDTPETQALLKAHGLNPAHKPNMKKVIAYPLDALMPQRRTDFNAFANILNNMWAKLGIPPKNRRFFYGDVKDIEGNAMSEAEYQSLLAEIREHGFLIDEYLQLLSARDTIKELQKKKANNQRFNKQTLAKAIRDRDKLNKMFQTHHVQRDYLKALVGYSRKMTDELLSSGGAHVFISGVGPNYEGKGHIGFMEAGAAANEPLMLGLVGFHMASDHMKENGGAATLYAKNGKKKFGFVTFGFKELLAHPKVSVLVLATGLQKAAAILHGLEGEVDDEYPITHLQGENVTWFVDNFAARELRYNTNFWDFREVTREEWTEENKAKMLITLSKQLEKNIDALTVQDYLNAPGRTNPEIWELRRKNLNRLLRVNLQTSKARTIETRWEKVRSVVANQIRSNRVRPEEFVKRLGLQPNDKYFSINPHLDDDYLAMFNDIKALTDAGVDYHAFFTTPGFTAVDSNYVFEMFQWLTDHFDDVAITELIRNGTDEVLFVEAEKDYLTDLVRVLDTHGNVAEKRGEWDYDIWRRESDEEKTIRAKIMFLRLVNRNENLRNKLTSKRQIQGFAQKILKKYQGAKTDNWGSEDISLMREIKTVIRFAEQQSGLMRLGVPYQNVHYPMSASWYGGLTREGTVAKSDVEEIYDLLNDDRPPVIAVPREAFGDAGAHDNTKRTVFEAVRRLVIQTDGRYAPKVVGYRGVWDRDEATGLPSQVSVMYTGAQVEAMPKAFHLDFRTQAGAEGTKIKVFSRELGEYRYLSAGDQPVADSGFPGPVSFGEQVSLNAEIGKKENELLGGVLPEDVEGVLNFRVTDFANPDPDDMQNVMTMLGQLDDIRGIVDESAMSKINGPAPYPKPDPKEIEALLNEFHLDAEDILSHEDARRSGYLSYLLRKARKLIPSNQTARRKVLTDLAKQVSHPLSEAQLEQTSWSVVKVLGAFHSTNSRDFEGKDEVKNILTYALRNLTPTRSEARANLQMIKEKLPKIAEQLVAIQETMKPAFTVESPVDVDEVVRTFYEIQLQSLIDLIETHIADEADDNLALAEDSVITVFNSIDDIYDPLSDAYAVIDGLEGDVEGLLDTLGELGETAGIQFQAEVESALDVGLINALGGKVPPSSRDKPSDEEIDSVEGHAAADEFARQAGLEDDAHLDEDLAFTSDDPIVSDIQEILDVLDQSFGPGGFLQVTGPLEQARDALMQVEVQAALNALETLENEIAEIPGTDEITVTVSGSARELPQAITALVVAVQDRSEARVDQDEIDFHGLANALDSVRLMRHGVLFQPDVKPLGTHISNAQKKWEQLNDPNAALQEIEAFEGRFNKIVNDWNQAMQGEIKELKDGIIKGGVESKGMKNQKTALEAEVSQSRTTYGGMASTISQLKNVLLALAARGQTKGADGQTAEAAQVTRESRIAKASRPFPQIYRNIAGHDEYKDDPKRAYRMIQRVSRAAIAVGDEPLQRGSLYYFERSLAPAEVTDPNARLKSRFVTVVGESEDKTTLTFKSIFPSVSETYTLTVEEFAGRTVHRYEPKDVATVLTEQLKAEFEKRGIALNPDQFQRYAGIRVKALTDNPPRRVIPNAQQNQHIMHAVVEKYAPILGISAGDATLFERVTAELKRSEARSVVEGQTTIEGLKFRTIRVDKPKAKIIVIEPISEESIQAYINWGDVDVDILMPESELVADKERGGLKPGIHGKLIPLIKKGNYDYVTAYVNENFDEEFYRVANEDGRKLIAINSFGTGVNNLHKEIAAQFETSLTNAPGPLNTPMAEFTDEMALRILYNNQVHFTKVKGSKSMATLLNRDKVDSTAVARAQILWLGLHEVAIRMNDSIQFVLDGKYRRTGVGPEATNFHDSFGHNAAAGLDRSVGILDLNSEEGRLLLKYAITHEIGTIHVDEDEYNALPESFKEELEVLRRDVLSRSKARAKEQGTTIDLKIEIKRVKRKTLLEKSNYVINPTTGDASITKKDVKDGKLIDSKSLYMTDPSILTKSMVGINIGLDSFGRISEAVAQRLVSLGANIISHQRKSDRPRYQAKKKYIDRMARRFSKVYGKTIRPMRYVTPSELFERSHIIIPFTPPTDDKAKGFITVERLELFLKNPNKPVYGLINTNRGLTWGADEVAEKKIFDFIRRHPQILAFTDTVVNEPGQTEKLFLFRGKPIANIFGTGHTGSGVPEVRIAMETVALKNQRALIDGKPALNPVRSEARSKAIEEYLEDRPHGAWIAIYPDPENPDYRMGGIIIYSNKAFPTERDQTYFEANQARFPDPDDLRQAVEKYTRDDERAMKAGPEGIYLEEDGLKVAKLPYKNRDGKVVGVIGMFAPLDSSRLIDSTVQGLHRIQVKENRSEARVLSEDIVEITHEDDAYRTFVLPPRLYTLPAERDRPSAGMIIPQRDSFYYKTWRENPNMEALQIRIDLAAELDPALDGARELKELYDGGNVIFLKADEYPDIYQVFHRKKQPGEKFPDMPAERLETVLKQTQGMTRAALAKNLREEKMHLETTAMDVEIWKRVVDQLFSSEHPVLKSAIEAKTSQEVYQDLGEELLAMEVLVSLLEIDTKEEWEITGALDKIFAGDAEARAAVQGIYDRTLPIESQIDAGISAANQLNEKYRDEENAGAFLGDWVQGENLPAELEPGLSEIIDAFIERNAIPRDELVRLVDSRVEWQQANLSAIRLWIQKTFSEIYDPRTNLEHLQVRQLNPQGTMFQIIGPEAAAKPSVVRNIILAADAKGSFRKHPFYLQALRLYQNPQELGQGERLIGFGMLEKGRLFAIFEQDTESRSEARAAVEMMAHYAEELRSSRVARRHQALREIERLTPGIRDELDMTKFVWTLDTPDTRLLEERLNPTLQKIEAGTKFLSEAASAFNGFPQDFGLRNDLVATYKRLGYLVSLHSLDTLAFILKQEEGEFRERAADALKDFLEAFESSLEVLRSTALSFEDPDVRRTADDSLYHFNVVLEDSMRYRIDRILESGVENETVNSLRASLETMKRMAENNRGVRELYEKVVRPQGVVVQVITPASEGAYPQELRTSAPQQEWVEAARDRLVGDFSYIPRSGVPQKVGDEPGDVLYVLDLYRSEARVEIGSGGMNFDRGQTPTYARVLEIQSILQARKKKSKKQNETKQTKQDASKSEVMDEVDLSPEPEVEIVDKIDALLDEMKAWTNWSAGRRQRIQEEVVPYVNLLAGFRAKVGVDRRILEAQESPLSVSGARQYAEESYNLSARTLVQEIQQFLEDESKSVKDVRRYVNKILSQFSTRPRSEARVKVTLDGANINLPAALIQDPTKVSLGAVLNHLELRPEQVKVRIMGVQPWGIDPREAGTYDLHLHTLEITTIKQDRSEARVDINFVERHEDTDLEKGFAFYQILKTPPLADHAHAHLGHFVTEILKDLGITKDHVRSVRFGGETLRYDREGTQQFKKIDLHRLDEHPAYEDQYIEIVFDPTARSEARRIGTDGTDSLVGLSEEAKRRMIQQQYPDLDLEATQQVATRAQGIYGLRIQGRMLQEFFVPTAFAGEVSHLQAFRKQAPGLMDQLLEGVNISKLRENRIAILGSDASRQVAPSVDLIAPNAKAVVAYVRGNPKSVAAFKFAVDELNKIRRSKNLPEIIVVDQESVLEETIEGYERKGFEKQQIIGHYLTQTEARALRRVDLEVLLEIDQKDLDGEVANTLKQLFHEMMREARISTAA